MGWRQGQSYSEDLRARVLAAVDGGMAARAALHEIQHLQGITILDHATPSQRSKAMKAIVAALKMKVAKK